MSLLIRVFDKPGMDYSTHQWSLGEDLPGINLYSIVDVEITGKEAEKLFHLFSGILLNHCFSGQQRFFGDMAKSIVYGFILYQAEEKALEKK